MNYVYFSTTDGALLDNFDIARASFIVDGNHIDYNDLDAIRNYTMKCKGIKKEIKTPSIKYLIKRGFKLQAVKVYKRSHPDKSLSEVKKIVDSIAEKIDI